MSFSKLNLSEKVLLAVEKIGYSEPSQIQKDAIPHIMERRDVIGIARTGTGKTASFTLPMLTLLEKGRTRARMPRTLIIEPTRELAAQVEEKFKLYGINHNLTIALLIGGVSFDEQLRLINRGSDVLIATPGRLLDHFGRGKLLLSGVEILVIDEVDRMLDMGFIADIEKICHLLPNTRQTLLFSATMSREIRKIADKFLTNPVEVEASPANTTSITIVQKLVGASNVPCEKRATLREKIDQQDDLTNAIIFCNRKRDVTIVERSLARHRYSVVSLHGDMEQNHRLATLEEFRSGEKQLLVASDVASRGLDLPKVSHVFNFDVPHHPEDYVHRIGRTGRAGSKGCAITIVTPEEKRQIGAIEKLIQQPIEWLDAPVVRDNQKTEPKQQLKQRHQRTRHVKRGAGTKAVKPLKTTDTPKPLPPQKAHDGGDTSGNNMIGVDGNIPSFLLKPVQFKVPKQQSRGKATS